MSGDGRRDGALCCYRAHPRLYFKSCGLPIRKGPGRNFKGGSCATKLGADRPTRSNCPETAMSWTRERSLALIREVGLVPIVRAPSPEDAIRAAEAIISGGIGIAEITMTVPNAIRVMERVTERYGDKVLLGAGTILDPESCRAALLAGAEFIEI